MLYSLPSVGYIKIFMKEALSGIFLHVSCAAGINFKVKKKIKNLTEASLLHLSSFPCRGKRVEVEAELFTRLAKVPHHRKARNISPKNFKRHQWGQG